MVIAIVGDGPMAEVLAHAVEHAGHTVVWTRGGDVAGAASDADIVILAGAPVADHNGDVVARLAVENGCTIIDAAEPALLPHPTHNARVVRAFASVPVDALAGATDGDSSQDLAVPLAGDHQDAKAVVARLMHNMGVEPFDIGSLSAGAVLERGGALWGRALTPVELLERVGELSGDG